MGMSLYTTSLGSSCSINAFSPILFFLSDSVRHAMGDDMASAFTPPMECELSPRLNDGTFRAFIHDTHHAYLLLHRAFRPLRLCPQGHVCEQGSHKQKPCSKGEWNQPHPTKVLRSTVFTNFRWMHVKNANQKMLSRTKTKHFAKGCHKQYSSKRNFPREKMLRA